jgi:hypothetical protein
MGAPVTPEGGSFWRLKKAKGEKLVSGESYRQDTIEGTSKT